MPMGPEISSILYLVSNGVSHWWTTFPDDRLTLADISEDLEDQSQYLCHG